MASPCRKCGATKTESTHHGVAYKLVRALGYRLRECSRCRRWRLLPRLQEASREPPSSATTRISQPSPDPARSPAQAPASVEPERHEGREGPEDKTARLPCRACPRCGSANLRRSRRRWIERLRGVELMARCRDCQRRFRCDS